MQLSFTALNFQSTDIEAEERNYLNHHVALAARMPGTRLYYTGRVIAPEGRAPEQFRAAIMGFDDAQAAATAMSSEVIPPLIADSQAHLKDLVQKFMDAEVIVPFDSRRPGDKCFLMAAEFDLEMSGGLGAAERHYLETHVGIARRLPGLRNYMIGKFLEMGQKPDRYRSAILVFDSHDDCRAAYRSPVGQELIKDEEATIRNGRVWRLDARVEV